MTTDSELLELAAKAAGLRVVDRSHPVTLYVASDGCSGGVSFNPLNDDGDALRLAVKLGIDISKAQIEFYDKSSTDPYAATRRAIVRAAAEIGRSME